MAKKQVPNSLYERVSCLENCFMGVHSPNGWRVIRVTKAKWNTAISQIVMITGAAYGGDLTINGGFNGDTITLDDRKCFTGTAVVGVIAADGHTMLPVDQYVLDNYHKEQQNVSTETLETPPTESPPAIYRRTPPGIVPFDSAPPARSANPRSLIPKTPPVMFEEDKAPVRPLVAADVSPSTGIPALTSADWLGENLAKELTHFLQTNPHLLEGSDKLPGDPFWDLVCPDGGIMHLAGYGFRKGKELCVAEQIRIYTYTKGDVRYEGTKMPDTEVIESARGLVGLVGKAPQRSAKAIETPKTPAPVREAPAVKAPAAKAAAKSKAAAKPKGGKKKIKPGIEALDIEPAVDADDEPTTKSGRKKSDDYDFGV